MGWREAFYMRQWRATHREVNRAYMRRYMRAWRAANREIAQANVAASTAKYKARWGHGYPRSKH